MKRKIRIILIAALVITAISTSVVFADENGDQSNKSAIESMFDAMRGWGQKALDNGEITDEEAKNWNNHFNDMERYHKENGFSGHCGGQNNFNGDAESQSYTPYRGGMMNGTSRRDL